MISPLLYAQNSQKSVVIGTMTTRPNALLILNPPGANQGILLPQLSTSSRIAMRPMSPDEDGLIVFDVTEKEFYYWKENNWVEGLGTAHLDQVTEIPLQEGNAGKFLTTDGSQVSWKTLPVSTSGAAPAQQSYSIDPSDFYGVGDERPDKNNSVIFEDNDTFITLSRRSEASKLIAPFHLPDGATIQQIVLYYMDRDIQNFSFSVMRRPYAGTNENIVPVWTSSANTPNIQTSTHTIIPGKDIIDNSLYSYRIVVDLHPSVDANNPNDATHRVYGIQIKFVK